MKSGAEIGISDPEAQKGEKILIEKCTVMDNLSTERLKASMNA